MTEADWIGITLLILALFGAAIPSIAKVIDGGSSIDPALDRAIYISAAAGAILGIYLIFG